MKWLVLSLVALLMGTVTLGTAQAGPRGGGGRARGGMGGFRGGRATRNTEGGIKGRRIHGGSGFGQGGGSYGSDGTSSAPDDSGLPAQDAGYSEDGSDDGSAEDVAVQTTRYLQIKNDTGRQLQLWVQYRVQDEQGNWSWLPSVPNRHKAMRYTLKPGATVNLASQGEPVAASRVRLWARAGDRSWDEYKDSNLWLVPEQDASGEHRYEAPDIGTFTFTFPAETTAANDE